MHVTEPTSDPRSYRRAVRRAFATVTFYREQCAAAGRLLDRPDPTPIGALPEPPHTLCPFAHPWWPDREPSLWTSELRPLARVLRLAGCRRRLSVLEVRDSLLDHARLPRRYPWRRGSPYRVLLAPSAIVASSQQRNELNQAALADTGGGWVVGEPDQLADLPVAAGTGLHPVHRLPVAAVATVPPASHPTVLYEPALGYLGALVPECRQFHLDNPRVYAHQRDGVITFSLPGFRRPTLLDILPSGTERLAVRRCGRHGTPVLVASDPAGGS